MKARSNNLLKLHIESSFQLLYKIIYTPSLLCLISIILGIILYKFIFLFFIIYLFLFIKTKKFGFIIFFVIFILSSVYTNRYLDVFNTEIKEQNIETFGYVIEPMETKTYYAETIVHLKGFKGFTQIQTSKYPQLIVGDEIKFQGQINKINESNFNFKYLKSKRINSSSKFPEVTVLKRGNSFTSFLAIQREKIIDIINKELGEPNASLLNGIVLGKKESFDKELENNLIRSGTSHIVSASGTNVVILYILVDSLKGFIKRKYLSFISILIIILYLFIIGIYILPATRATVMLLIFITGNLLGRKNNILIALSISVILILIQYPLYYQNISFQLSFFATIGLFSFNKLYFNFLKRLFSFLPLQIIEILSATIAVTILTIPISLLNFRSVSLLAIIANIFIIPFITLLTLLTIWGIFIYILKIALIYKVTFLLINSILNLITFIINCISSLPFSYSQNNYFNLLFLSILYISLIIIYYHNNDEST